MEDIDINAYESLDILKKTKMMFIFNALEKGWKIKKKAKDMYFQRITKEKKKFF